MSNMSPEERDFLQNRADFALARDGGFQERRFENMGVDLVTRLGYPYRGADFTLSALLTWEQSRSWDSAGVGGENMESVLMRGALYDLGVLPRLRELDQTLAYNVSSGPALLLNDTRGAINRTCEVVELEAKGKDLMIDNLEKYRRADAYHHNLTLMRDDVQGRISPKRGDPRPTEHQIDVLDRELNTIEISLLEAGINAGVRQGALEDDLRNLTLAGESLSVIGKCKGDAEKAKEALLRLRQKRKVVVRVEQAVAGLNESARFLGQLVSMQTDMGGIIKVFTGPEPAIPSHMLRFLSLSPQVREGVTIAMSEMFKLCYQKTGVDGKVVPDSKLTTSGGIDRSLTAAKKYTPAQRDNFFQVWEDVVQAGLIEKGVVGSVKLSEDAVSLSCLLMEMFTLGQTAYIRDRKSGKIIDKAHGGIDSGSGGSGSMYDKGGVDTVDKVHQVQDRKWSEATKGRAAPRPGVIKGLSQELLYSIFQYTEAKKGDTNLGVSVLEAIISRQGGYDIGDFIDNLTSSSHFSYMLFAFRACQISDKLEQMINGRISPLKELGGGPEKMVEDMVDSLQGLHKAFQTIPFAVDGNFQFSKSGKEANVVEQTIEVQRNMVNLVADFLRGAMAANTATGGFNDNPNWRGFVDLLPTRVKERLVLYGNVLTPQQYNLALQLAKESNNAAGGTLTQEMVNESDRIGDALREILSRGSDTNEDSIAIMVKRAGIPGHARSSGELDEALVKVINASADDTLKKQSVGEINRKDAGMGGSDGRPIAKKI